MRFLHVPGPVYYNMQKKGNHLGRREFIAGTMRSATTAAASTTRVVAQPLTHPNILYIFADDMGWGNLTATAGLTIKRPISITSRHRGSSSPMLIPHRYVRRRELDFTQAGIRHGCRSVWKNRSTNAVRSANVSRRPAYRESIQQFHQLSRRQVTTPP